MSEVLAARLRAELDVVLANPNLTRDEMAYELLDAVLPLDDQAEWDNPIWWHLLIESGVCTNCLTDDCGCCVGCGGINADTDPAGTHGYWCAL